MLSQGWLTHLPLLALLIVAALTDARARRIPNWLTLTLVLSGIAQSFAAGGITPAQSAAGIAIGFTVPFVLYLLGGLGAGDVKLLAGVGAWIGPLLSLEVFAAAAVLGLMLVLIQCACQGRLKTLFQNTAALALCLINARRAGAAQVVQVGQNYRSIDKPLPYAVPVCAAVLLVLTISMLRAG